MKRTLFATTMLGAMALSFTASAQGLFDMNAPLVGKDAGALMVRARAVGVLPGDSNSSISAIGGHVGASQTAVPELDFSYFFTDHLATELILATSQHTLQAKGTAVGSFDVGTVWALPPTLTLQYHFLPHEAFSPYVGAGLNGTLWYGEKPSAPVTHFNVGNSWGPAFQVGFDYNFAGRWFLNMDAKYILMNVAAHVDALNTTVRAHDQLNPVLLGAGIGYRF
ncbi:MAG TPA: OmpW family protein [Acetobacteraceae bacterium]|jgi:outer membrane protein|nr:OmpW family protein [Acetobacteraceae bacterium]